MMSQATEMFMVGVDKVDEYLEHASKVVADYVSQHDQLLTIKSHDQLYNMSLVADWFHQVPHVDIKLRPLPANITFDPNDNEYLESLGILVALPGFWLILTLLFFLIFFLCRCCESSGNESQSAKQFNQQQQILLGKSSASKAKKGKAGKRMTGCKLCLALLTLITCCVITVTLLGSVITHRGMLKLRSSTEDIANVLETVQNDTRIASKQLRDGIDNDIEALKRALETMLVKSGDVKSNLENNLFFLKRNVTKCARRVDEIYTRMEKINMRPVPDMISLIEKIRWPATFGLAFGLSLFCLILLCGLVRHSRCTLIMFSVFGLLALVLGWVLSSFYLGILVAGSDFCAEPDPFMIDRFSSKVELAIYDYYVRCPANSGAQNAPFRRQTRESLAAIEHMSKLIRDLEMLCVSYCDPYQDVREQIKSIADNLTESHRLMHSVQGLLDCRRIHDDFVTSMSATCKDLVEGTFLMLASSVALGLLFTLLVLCASHTWIHIRSGSSSSISNASSSVASAHGSASLLGTLDDQETDPFLSHGSTPHHHQFGGAGSGHHQSLHHSTMLSNSTSSSISGNNTLGAAKRFRDSYSSAYGTTGRRFGHTPPTAPSFATLGAGGRLNSSTNGPGNAGRSEEQLSFLSPPPAYDQLSQAQQLAQQQQQQLHSHYQAVQQQQHQHSIYGTHVGTLQHAQHMQQQQQQAHLQQQQHQQHAQLMAQQQAQHPNAIGHYVADANDIMIRAPTLATKF